MIKAVILLFFQINIIGIVKSDDQNYDRFNLRPFRPADRVRVCVSKGCIKAAYTLIESIDEKINPCDDFYQFSCGNWNKKRTIPSNLPEYNPLFELAEILNIDLKNLLENIKDDEAYQPFKKIGIYYKSCMNEVAINNLKSQPLSDYLKTTIGGWPVVETDKWNENSFDWIKATANLRLYDTRLLIMSYVGPDGKNNRANIMSIDQGSFGISGNYLLYKKYKPQRQAYLDFMTGTAAILNGNPLSKEQENELLDVLIFEQRLANITATVEERSNFTRLYNPMTFEELKLTYDNIDFESYFKILLADTKPLQDTDILIVNEIEFFHKLGELISHTPKRTMANYLGWRGTQTVSAILPQEYKVVQSKFLEALSGSVIPTERWRTCVDAANGDLPFATGKLYTDAHFTQESKNSIDSLLQDLRREFQGILTNNDWMDLNTKRYALKKLNAMITQIGYPDKYQDPAALEQEFKDINVNADTFFQNKLSVLLSRVKRTFKSLPNPVDKTEWPSGPADINAKNDILRNSLVFPAAFLQSPIFDADRPRSLNYGSVGMVIGHEITHGYDNRGKQFGIEGNLEEWWSESAQKSFENKANCMINQYKNYYIPEAKLNVSGLNTLPENIADNAGVKEAFKAFKYAERRFGVEPILPGLNYNHDQLFFLSFAHTWCGISRPETLRFNILTDVHAPGKFRVIGPLSNSKDFQRTFNCPNNSKMVNQSPCNVW